MMKHGGLLAMMLAASSIAAHAQDARGKVWVNEACTVMFESPKDESGPFVVSTLDGAYRNSCRIADWPINEPAATMLCSDNTRPTMELDGVNVILDGVDFSGDGSSITLLPTTDVQTDCP